MSDQNAALNMLVAAAISQGTSKLTERSTLKNEKPSLTLHAKAVVEMTKGLLQEQKQLVVKEILNLKSTEPTGLPSLNPLPFRRHIRDYASQQKCEEHVLSCGASDVQSALNSKQVKKESIGTTSSRFLYRYERDGSGKLGDWFLTLYQ